MKRMFSIVFAIVFALALTQMAQAQAPQGVVVTPPSPQISASISVPKPVYQPGERIIINYNVSVDAYVYVIDIDAVGNVTQIFPNIFSQNNFVQAGNHSLPDNNAYSLVVTPPNGTEVLQIIATLQPINLGANGFGQGFPSLGNNPEAFQQAAEAAIQGIVPTGEVATAFTTFQIGNTPPPPPSNNAPVANFTASPSNPSVGQNVFFNAAGSFDSDGFITQYRWDFNNDGVTDATGQQVNRAFFSPGNVSVRLTVTDNLGLTSTTTQFLTVSQPSQPPVASFTINPNNPLVGQSVTFNAGNSFDPDGFIAQYRWDFNGDGLTDATGAQVNRTFFSPGNVTVRLTVIDNQNLTATSTQFLTVTQQQPQPQPTIPGFFVTSPSPNVINIRVQGQSSWNFQNRGFRILLETDGVFTGVSQQGTGQAAPQGISPVPNQDTLELNGFVSNGSITYNIALSSNATKLKFDLRLDIDGDGDLERRTNFVFLGDSLVNPPTNPFVLNFNAGNMMFDASLRICLVLIDQPGIHFSICFRLF